MEPVTNFKEPADLSNLIDVIPESPLKNTSSLNVEIPATDKLDPIPTSPLNVEIPETSRVSVSVKPVTITPTPDVLNFVFPE